MEDDLILDAQQNLYYSHDSILKGILRFCEYTYIDNIDNTTSSHTYTNSSLENTESNSDMNELNNVKTSVNGWDAQKACQWIEDNSYPYYIKDKCGKCAKFVRSAIDIGFNTNPNGNNSYTGIHGRPQWAWKYMNFLPKIGFKHIGSVSRSQMNSFVPKSGDIAVYQKNGNPNVPGHICMYSDKSKKWISDYKQNSMFAYQKTQQAEIYRFQG